MLCAPMWNGWNSERVNENGPKQCVFYMKHIQAPPTRIDVVRETMERSLDVARECGDSFGLMSYNLVIAKIAKQLQREESPSFDDLFIMFGACHTQLAVKQYQLYLQETLADKRDKTAQFWMTCVRFMDFFLLLHRAIEDND